MTSEITGYDAHIIAVLRQKWREAEEKKHSVSQDRNYHETKRAEHQKALFNKTQELAKLKRQCMELEQALRKLGDTRRWYK